MGPTLTRTPYVLPDEVSDDDDESYRYDGLLAAETERLKKAARGLRSRDGNLRFHIPDCGVVPA